MVRAFTESSTPRAQVPIKVPFLQYIKYFPLLSSLLTNSIRAVVLFMLIYAKAKDSPSFVHHGNWENNFSAPTGIHLRPITDSKHHSNKQLQPCWQNPVSQISILKTDLRERFPWWHLKVNLWLHCWNLAEMLTFLLCTPSLHKGTSAIYNILQSSIHYSSLKVNSTPGCIFKKSVSW